MIKNARNIPVLFSIAVALFTAALFVGQQQVIVPEPEIVSHEPIAIIRADTLAWTPAPLFLPKGASMALLSGDPTKPGLFVMRLKLPPGYRLPPHTHTNHEYITVISGSFNVGMGTEFDMSEGKAMPAGSFIRLPGKMPHYAWAASETVIQVEGIGPFDIIYSSPKDDPRTTARAYTR